MGKKTISTLLASALMLVTGTGIAGPEDKSYFGIQYGIGEYSEKNISKNFKPTALIGRFGYYFHPNFSLEGRLGYGLQDDTQFLPEFGPSGLDAKFKLDSIIGVYAVGHISPSEYLSFYGVLGVSRIEATASIPAFPAANSTDEETGISYGLGADIFIYKRVTFNIEYMKYLDKTKLDLGMIGVGASARF